eukprot:734916-Heterocapsa_arctica.AAC.1
MQNYPGDDTMEGDTKIWTKQSVIPASYIEGLECQNGRGTWTMRRNPTCFRCDIINKAEMETQIPNEKGPTI